jgi:hypothetical protein
VRRLRACAAVALLAAGCGEANEREESVPIEQVPPVVLEAAKKKLPGYTFQAAYKIKFEGKDAFELRGKDKRGKISEVEVDPAGNVLLVE